MTSIKARVGGNWVDLATAYGSNVWVGPEAPTNPNMEFWVDTDAVLASVPWNAPAYSTNWAGFSTNAAMYRKIGDIVYLQGGIIWGAGTVAEQSQLICTLPVGYRPPVVRRFTAWYNNVGQAKRITADTNGQVYMDSAVAASNTWEISLIFSITT